MIKSITVLLCLLSLQVHANEAGEIKKLMSKYLMAIGKKTPDKLKSITSPKYFKTLQKSKALEKSFKRNKNKISKKIDFDMVYKKGAKTKELIFVNIKDVSTKDYGDHWYLVKKVNGKYIIDDMRFLD